MKLLFSPRGRAWLLAGLAWGAFYLTLHFEVNDEQYAFWLPMKFVVAGPQFLFSVVAVYGFGYLFARPLEVPVWRVLLYGAASFVLLHLVYYVALRAAQPFAPHDSVTYRRWMGFMAPQGPFYFLRNLHYLRTVSPFLFFSHLCLPLGVKLLRDSFRESQQLAAAQRQQLAAELTAARTRLNPAFFQQTLGQITHFCDHQQAATAAEVTLKLAQVLRHTLYESGDPHAPLASELNAYLDYVQLQELRLQEQLDIHLHLTVAHAEQYLIRTGVLLPLTEQWLALPATTAEVELRVQDAQLSLRLSTNCPPRQATSVVAAMQAHLAAHAGHGYRLSQRSTATGLTLVLHLRLQPSTRSAAGL